MLARSVVLLEARREPGAVIAERVFGESPDRPAPLERITAQVRAAIANAPPAAMLVLDDGGAAANPLSTREAIQSIAGLVGRRPVCLRAAAGAMALANVLVALKSGVRHLGVAGSADRRYAPREDVAAMLSRMGVEIAPPG